jgi:hypothetical protein
VAPRHQREISRHLGRVFRGAPRKTDPPESCFLSSQSLCVVDRLNRDQQLRTANIVHRQAESQSHRPQRDSDFDPFLAVDMLSDPSCVQ